MRKRLKSTPQKSVDSTLKLRISFIRKNLRIPMVFWPSQTRRGFWQWEALGKLGEEETQQKAISVARDYVLNINQ